ncbi:MAG: hypothetical protein JSV85_04060 [Candidatus Bathyarchaeota archaeon]|nr:MAG: hypothetical protein JSV85_04060 [Candidatus Bathyarchaeota archaeon]
MQNLLSSAVIIAIASFASSLFILTFYFSSIISIRSSLNKHGFIIALLGTGTGTIFLLSLPLIQADSIPWLDIGHVLVSVVWLPLVKYYTKMGWLGSSAAALFGVLFYAIVSVISTALASGFLQIFAPGL